MQMLTRCSFTMDDDVTLRRYGDIKYELHGNELPGAADALQAQTQLEWLEETLKNSTAEFLVVAGQ